MSGNPCEHEMSREGLELHEVWSASETLKLFKTLPPIETLELLNRLTSSTMAPEALNSFDPDWEPLNMAFWALNIKLLPQDETNLEEYWSSFLQLTCKTLSPLDTSLSPTQKRIFGTIRDTIRFTLGNMSERSLQIKINSTMLAYIKEIWDLKAQTPKEILNFLKP